MLGFVRLLPAACAAFLAAAAPAVADEDHRAQHDGVQAKLATFGQPSAPGYAIRMEINRAGRVLLSESIEGRASRGVTPLGVMGDRRPVTVADLDADGEPEVLFDLYTGGAHCCTVTRIYGLDAASGTYRRRIAEWGNGIWYLQDLQGDGRPELTSRDDRFAAVFSSYARSAYPPRFWSWEAGRLVDVTRRHPAQVRVALRRHRAAWVRARRGPGEASRGPFAAYVADLRLLGRTAESDRLITSAVRRGWVGRGRGARRYADRLQRFLRASGYR